MDDRELLERAARAAGKLFDPTVRDKRGLWVVKDNARCQSEQELWNSLTDDGDALRLAVDLRFAVTTPTEEDPLIVFIEGASIKFVHTMADGGDPYAATRRAITEAAAASLED